MAVDEAGELQANVRWLASQAPLRRLDYCKRLPLMRSTHGDARRYARSFGGASVWLQVLDTMWSNR